MIGKGPPTPSAIAISLPVGEGFDQDNRRDDGTDQAREEFCTSDRASRLCGKEKRKEGRKSTKNRPL